MTSANFETTTVEESPLSKSVTTDLSDVEPSAYEQRVLRDIKFTVVAKRRGNQGAPSAGPNQGGFPENMPGPLQYGNGQGIHDQPSGHPDGIEPGLNCCRHVRTSCPRPPV